MLCLPEIGPSQAVTPSVVNSFLFHFPFEVLIVSLGKFPILSVLLLLLSCSLAFAQSSPPATSPGSAASEQPSAPAAETNAAKALVIQDQQPPMAATRLKIGSGDLAEISVFGIPELTQKVRVNSNGDVSLSLIGMVHLAGLSPDQAERQIEKMLVQGGYVKDPHASVLLVEYATQGVSVMGEVAKPGVYPVLGTRRLFDVISAASGLTDKAGRTVTITHRDHPQEPQVITLSKDPSKALEANIEVMPGDTVLVSRAGVVFVVGDVTRPSGFTIDKNDGLTVLQAIALAEGNKSTASLDKAKLIRKTSQGPEEISIPLKRILQGKSKDLALQAEDIVFVPGSLTRSAGKRTLEAILQTATGVAIY